MTIPSAQARPSALEDKMAPGLLEVARVLTPRVGPTIDQGKLERLRQSRPDAVAAEWDARRAWLVEYQQEGTAVKLIGRALRPTDVAELLDRLTVSSELSDVRLLAAVPIEEPPAVAFEVTATELRADAKRERISLKRAAWRGASTRDPFEPPAEVLGKLPAPRPLRLIATLVRAAGGDRAVVQNAEGKGILVRIGDVVDGEVEAMPSARREIRWKVERIDPSAIVLVHEDPSGALPPVRRTLPLTP